MISPPKNFGNKAHKIFAGGGLILNKITPQTAYKHKIFAGGGLILNSSRLLAKFLRFFIVRRGALLYIKGMRLPLKIAAAFFLAGGLAHAQNISTPDLDYLKETKLRQKADEGDMLSMYKLGLIYYYGDGKSYVYSSEDGKDIPLVNLREAFYWLKKASAEGHSDSLYHFGLLNLEEAQGDFRLEELGASEKEGLTALEAAAEGGHALAMYELSKIYLENDIKKGLYWERKAAEAGHTPSQYSIRMGAFHESDESAQKEAVHWFLSFVYKNTSRFGIYSMGHIAEAYFKGIGGLSPDPVKAYAWQSLFVEYYPACGDSEAFRGELLAEYGQSMSSDEKEEALKLAKSLKRDIESRSQTRLERLNFDCGN